MTLCSCKNTWWLTCASGLGASSSRIRTTTESICRRRRRNRLNWHSESPTTQAFDILNPLMNIGIIVPHRIIWSWYTGRWWVGCCIWYSAARPDPSSLYQMQQPTHQRPVYQLPYWSKTLCGFNVSIKGLRNVWRLTSVNSWQSVTRQHSSVHRYGSANIAALSRDWLYVSCLSILCKTKEITFISFVYSFTHKSMN